MYKAIPFIIICLLGVAVTPSSGWCSQATFDLVEEIVVVGKWPGPPLWRVQYGDHILWVFGTLRPMPRSFEWDSSSVAWTMAEAQSYLAPPNLSASTANPLKAINTLRKLRKLERLPKGQTLEAVIPAPLFEQLVAAKDRFGVKGSEFFQLRPLAAAERLAKKAYAATGLSEEPVLERSLDKMARKHDLAMIETTEAVSIEAALKIFENLPLEAELECLDTTLKSLMTDLQAANERARTWIDGDARLLARLDYPDVEAVCTNVVLYNETAAAARERSRSAWLRAAEQALRSNAVTFASLPIREVISPDGLIATLRSRVTSASDANDS